MLYIVFGSSLLITVVSIIHAIFVLGPAGLLEAITAQAQAATALIVADMGVLGSLVYRRIRKGRQDFDSKPYTYEFSVHTNASIHMRRVPRRPIDTNATHLQFNNNLDDYQFTTSYNPDDQDLHSDDRTQTAPLTVLKDMKGAASSSQRMSIEDGKEPDRQSMKDGKPTSVIP
ncbi:hypothetical protein PQX77_012924 [Marasmius sp. AFHP31]|nr:hypothetical protein PQX77_012924 [Marasmius sp. AFHP31]